MTSPIYGLVADSSSQGPTVAREILRIKTGAIAFPADYAARLSAAQLVNNFIPEDADPLQTEWQAMFGDTGLTIEQVKDSLQFWGESLAPELWCLLLRPILLHYTRDMTLPVIVYGIKSDAEAELIRELGGVVIHVVDATGDSGLLDLSPPAEDVSIPYTGSQHDLEGLLDVLVLQAVA